MQQEYKPGERREPDSLAPVQLERASIEEEIALMQRGKALPLTLALLLAALAATAGVRWIGQLDAQQAYTHAAERLETLDAQQGEAFLRCALPNVQRSQLSSTVALHTAIEVASERFDKFYGRQLAHCAHYLTDLESELAMVRVPTDMVRQMAAVRSAAREFQHAWDNYRAYLQDPALPYDFVRATPLIEKVTLAWGSYRAQQAEMTAALRAHD